MLELRVQTRMSGPFFLSTHTVPCKQMVLNKCLLMQMPYETVDVKMRHGTVKRHCSLGGEVVNAATDGGILFTSPNQW